MNSGANHQDPEQALTRLLDRRQELEEGLSSLLSAKEQEIEASWDSLRNLYASEGIYEGPDNRENILDREEWESKESNLRIQLEDISRSIREVNNEVRSLKDTEILYDRPDLVVHAAVTLPSLNGDFLREVALKPELMYRITPRRFEELVARILTDMGFGVDLTPMSRDGGFDILASLKSPLGGEFLTLVECKRYLPEKKVGVQIVRSLHGIIHLHRAHNAVLITTSSFSRDAIRESRSLNPSLDLHDYENLKQWLSKYSTGSA